MNHFQVSRLLGFAFLALLILAACSKKEAVRDAPAPVASSPVAPELDGLGPDDFTAPSILNNPPPDEAAASGSKYEALFTHRASRDVINQINQLKIVNDQAYADMFFKHYGVNPTIDTAEEPISTFAADVDRGSWTMAQSYIERGHMPPTEAIRVEEFVNAFDYGYEQPKSDSFTLLAEAFPSPTRPGYHLLHLGVKGKEVMTQDRKPANLVFVIDVSGSMGADNRLGEVKRSLSLLVDEMRIDDSVGIVTYGSRAEIVLAPTTGNARDKIRKAIDRLQVNGSTNAAAGVSLAYQLIQLQFDESKINRLILCSDGVANTGPATGAEGILQLIGDQTKNGVHLSTIGFGMGNYNDVMMEQLAQHGGGNYYYINSHDEARRVFVKNLTGTLQVIAEDMKIQVEFDANVVSRYRLIGFENRHLENEDFADDRVDAGEIGAGHSVTALYEIRIDQPNQPLGTFRVRHKEPGESRSQLTEKALVSSIIKDSLAAASPASRLALAVSILGEKLRDSYWVNQVEYQAVADLLDSLPAAVRADTEVAKFYAMLSKVRVMDTRENRFAGLASTDFDRVPVLQ